MIKVGTGISGERRTQRAADQAAQEAVQNAGINESDLALVFITTDHVPNFPQILKSIQTQTGAKQIVGASGYGVLTEKMEIEHAPGVAVMTLASDSFDTDAFLVPNVQEDNLSAGRTIGAHLQGKSFAKNLFVIFPDPFSLRSPNFFQGYADEAADTALVGGLASEDGSQRMTYQFLNDRVLSDAVSGFLMSGNFRASSFVTQCCLPASNPIKITKADENLILELADAPAYDVLLSVLDQFEIKDFSTLLNFLFVGVPIFPDQSEFTHANYSVRNVIGVDPQKKMIAIGGPVPQGENMVFLIRDPNMARRDTKEMLEEATNSLTRNHFGFYFNACGRGQSLYNRPNVDTRMIHEVFPQIPIIGFFTFGEIGPVQGMNMLHNYSGVLTLIGE